MSGAPHGAIFRKRTQLLQLYAALRPNLCTMAVSGLILAALLALVGANGSARATAGPSTFGGSQSALRIPTPTGDPAVDEVLLYTYDEDPTDTPKMLTYFWFTCGSSDGTKCVNIGDTRFRYYVDGEAVASIDGKLFAAHGMGLQPVRTLFRIERAACIAQQLRYGPASHSC